MTLISGEMCRYNLPILLVNPHHPVKLHFQESDEPSVLLTANLMELQNTVHRIAREFEFLHRFLYGIVFRLALLLGTLREVEVEL